MGFSLKFSYSPSSSSSSPLHLKQVNLICIFFLELYVYRCMFGKATLGNRRYIFYPRFYFNVVTRSRSRSKLNALHSTSKIFECYLQQRLMSSFTLFLSAYNTYGSLGSDCIYRYIGKRKVCK